MKLGLWLACLSLTITPALAKDDPFFHAAMKLVQPRIDHDMLRLVNQRPDPFSLPSDVFFNRDFDNPQLMEKVFSASRLVPSFSWEVSDYLRNPAENIKYHVTSNSLGFRGKERSKLKPHGVFRVIVLGTSVTFGHGVSDDETYSARLEQLLNKKSKRMKFEVWNGGIENGTGIMGLSRLQREIFDYQPDLLLWDYGWPDPFMRSGMALSPSFIDRMPPRPFGQDQLLRLCQKTVFRHLRLCKDYVASVNRVDYAQSIAEWKEANLRMIAVAEQHHLPVLMLHHFGVLIAPELYRNLEDRAHGIYFFDTEPIFHRPASPAYQKLFWSIRPTWVDEIGASARDVGADPAVIYYTDAIRYGPIGHRIIGDEIAAELRKIPKLLP